MKTTPRAAVYVRVSTDKQAEKGLSLEAQDRACRKLGQELGYEVEVFRDEGFSAKNLKRPALQAMLDAIRAKRFAAVIVTTLDRLSRDTIDTLTLRREWSKAGIKFYAVGESTDDIATPDGELTLTMKAALSDAERKRISAKTRFLMAERRREGVRISGTAPVGYRFEDGIVVEDATEMAALHLVIEMAQRGSSYREIAGMLNAQGYRTKSGRLHHAMSVGRMLKSRAALAAVGE